MLRCLLRYVRSTMVSILAGSEQHPFHVHENRLLDESPNIADRFTRADDSHIKELKLPDTPIEAVEVLVDYLYHDNFASSATWEPTTTLDPFIHAWMLADQLDMEDAKNAIMDRLRFTVDKANTYEVEGSADTTLVRKAVVTMQSMSPQPKRGCPLYKFLVHRLVRNLVRKPGEFDTSIPAYQEKSFNEILHKGGDIVVDIVEECFKAKFSTVFNSQPDPAWLKGCHYHDHTPGRVSRVCSDVSDSTPANNAAERPLLKAESSSAAQPTFFGSGRASSSIFGVSQAITQTTNTSATIPTAPGFFSAPSAPSAFGGPSKTQAPSDRPFAGFSSNFSTASPFNSENGSKT